MKRIPRKTIRASTARIALFAYAISEKIRLRRLVLGFDGQSVGLSLDRQPTLRLPCIHHVRHLDRLRCAPDSELAIRELGTGRWMSAGAQALDRERDRLGQGDARRQLVPQIHFLQVSRSSLRPVWTEVRSRQHRRQPQGPSTVSCCLAPARPSSRGRRLGINPIVEFVFSV